MWKKENKCCICGTKVKAENNGLFIQENFFSLSENKKIAELIDNKKKLCIDCKKELLFANLSAKQKNHKIIIVILRSKDYLSKYALL